MQAASFGWDCMNRQMGPLSDIVSLLNMATIKLVMTLLLILALLAMSGDVESNPGPGERAKRLSSVGPRDVSNTLPITSTSQELQGLINMLSKKIRIPQLNVHAESQTLTSVVEILVVPVITNSLSESLKQQIRGMRLSAVLGILEPSPKENFLFLCYLASRAVNAADLHLEQVSACMLKYGIPSTDVLHEFDGLAEIIDGKLVFTHFLLKAFLAAIHHLFESAMNAVLSLTRDIFDVESGVLHLSSDGCFTLQFFSGLAGSGISHMGLLSLHHAIGQLCLDVDGSQPVEECLNAEIILLAMKCALEANDPKLCVMINKECLTSQTLVIHVEKVDINALSFFVAHTTKHDNYWVVYSSDLKMAGKLQAKVKQLGGLLLVKHREGFLKDVMIFSTRTYEYLLTSLKAFRAMHDQNTRASDNTQHEVLGRGLMLPAAEVLHMFSTEMVTLMYNPGLVATHLFEDGLISSDLRSDILSPNCRRHEGASKILKAVESGITSSSQGYNVISKLFSALEKSNEVFLEKTVAHMKDMLPYQNTNFASKNIKAFPVYGYQTSEHYEALQQMETSMFFNLIRDVFLPHLQLHSSSRFVEGEYRKMDHLWFKLAQSMRHDFYDFFKISPLVPIHWTKLQAPNGSVELEKKYKEQATAPRRLVVEDTRAAELIFLNSQKLNLVNIQNPSSNEEVTLLCYTCDDVINDQGTIGCGYQKPEFEVKPEDLVTCTPCKPFDIKTDQRVGRKLPLPSRKADMGASTTVGASAMFDEQPQGQVMGGSIPFSQAIPMDVPTVGKSLPHAQLTRTAQIQHTKESNEEKLKISEHQVKKLATESFNRPGVCFFGDEKFFSSHKLYQLPDSLSSCRVLREGGNGIVMEVKYDNELFAVKKTAFRWREILIMTKLKHKNILPLNGMIMGKPVESQPSRKYVFQFSPKFTNDLGRIVGSFEKYCLRTLNERYSSEKLLLRKIHSNFRHTAREILTALAYLHSRASPIVHRDVKASNVLVRMHCDCHSPLVCVCRRQPDIVLGDFDASLELSSDGTLQSDPPRPSLFGYHSPSSKTFHVSAVGTIGYKSPEGSQYMIGNNLQTMPPLTTKADIFSFGVLMLLLVVNEEGPKHQQQMAKLLLSVNQTVGPSQLLNKEKEKILERSGVVPRRKQVHICECDLHKIIPLNKVSREFGNEGIYDFMCKSLAIDPHQRFTATELLNHPYLAQDFIGSFQMKVQSPTSSYSLPTDSKHSQYLPATLRGPLSNALYYQSAFETGTKGNTACAVTSKSRSPFHKLLWFQTLPQKSSEFPNGVKSYLFHLRMCYERKQKPMLTENNFTSIPTEYIPLHLVEKQLKESEKLSNNVMEANKSLLGSKSAGNVIQLENVAQPLNGTVPKYILVQGSPGIGKTTFSHELSKQWNAGRILQHFTLVIMLQFRQKDISQAKTLEEMVDHPLPEIRKVVSQYLLSVSGKHTLFILDGFDEMSTRQLTSGCIIHKLLSNVCLQEATIMVTARPSATQQLPLIFRRLCQCIKILGFTGGMPFAYIQMLSPDQPIILDDFQSYLSRNPLLQSIMYIPLYCVMISELYKYHWEKGSSEPAPKNLMELYMALVLTLVLQHVNNHILCSEQQVKFNSFQDLPNSVYKKLVVLGKLAAEGIKKRKYTFEKLPCERIGLMHDNTWEVAINKPTASCSFLHLRLQEFLAVFYWSLNQPKQLSNKLVLPFMEKCAEGEKHLTNLPFLSIELHKARCLKSCFKPKQFFQRQKPTQKCVFSTSMPTSMVDSIQFLYPLQHSSATDVLLNHCVAADSYLHPQFSMPLRPRIDVYASSSGKSKLALARELHPVRDTVKTLKPVCSFLSVAVKTNFVLPRTCHHQRLIQQIMALSITKMITCVYNKRAFRSHDKFPTYFKEAFLHIQPKDFGLHIENFFSQIDKQQAQQLCPHGKMETCKTRNSLNSNDLSFLVGSKLSVKMLKENIPGIDKTIIAWGLCWQWKEGKLLKHFNSALLPQICNNQVRQFCTQHDIIYFFDGSVRQAIVKHLVSTGDKGVIIVIESHNKISLQQRSKDCVISLLLQRTMLSFATPLVTAQPAASHFPMESYQFQFLQATEVFGYRASELDTYIQSAFPDYHESLANFMSFLDSNPFPSFLVYILFQCQIVTELLPMQCTSGDKEFVHKSVTELCTAVVMPLLLYYLSGCTEYRHQKLDNTVFWGHSEDVYKILIYLANTAAKRVDRRRCSSVYFFVNIIGLRQKMEELYSNMGVTVISHSFLHLTLQEYLAALYWSKCSNNQLKQLLKRKNLFSVNILVDKDGEEDDATTRVYHWPTFLFLHGLKNNDEIEHDRTTTSCEMRMNEENNNNICLLQRIKKYKYVFQKLRLEEMGLMHANVRKLSTNIPSASHIFHLLIVQKFLALFYSSMYQSKQLTQTPYMRKRANGEDLASLLLLSLNTPKVELAKSCFKRILILAEEKCWQKSVISTWMPAPAIGPLQYFSTTNLTCRHSLDAYHIPVLRRKVQFPTTTFSLPIVFKHEIFLSKITDIKFHLFQESLTTTMKSKKSLLLESQKCDDVHSVERKIDFKEISQLSSGTQPKYILIQGRPQLKKTTYLRRFYRQCKAGILLQHYTLIIVLQSHKKCVRQASILRDVVDHQLPEIRQVHSQHSLLENGNRQSSFWIILMEKIYVLCATIPFTTCGQTIGFSVSHSSIG